MKAYTIFDDYTEEAQRVLSEAGVELTVHPSSLPRPDHDRMKQILASYDCVIIGTSQKITEDMFEGITSPRVIATASVGVDHIRVPEDKRALVTILNTPLANVQSVAEYTMGCALSCMKRLAEGSALYRAGRNNKALSRKPEELHGKTIGVIGAGNVGAGIMRAARLFGMNILCWTRNPAAHGDLNGQGVRFTSLEQLAGEADVISVNLPGCEGTRGLISGDLVSRMKENCVFISVSRLETMDVRALFAKAERTPSFYVCLDLDVNQEVVGMMPAGENVMVTPHIAGGTLEARERMFLGTAQGIAALCGRA